MKRTLAISLSLCLTMPVAGVAQISKSSDQTENADPAYAADYRAADLFKAALKANDRRAVAALIAYPLSREAPLRPINNPKEFLNHWDEYFDTTSTAKVLEAKPEQFGWRGIALANGIVWFAKGHIVSINLETAASKKEVQQARKSDSIGLYPSAKAYDSIAFQCRTKMLNVRTQYHGKDLRYFAWKNGASLSTKPEFALTGGIYDPQGTGGNYNLIFRNNDYTFQLEVGHFLCGEDCNDYLTVLKGTKAISHDVCTAIDK